jgi:hypothetical protein
MDLGYRRTIRSMVKYRTAVLGIGEFSPDVWDV